jgi:hypothetical protein
VIQDQIATVWRNACDLVPWEDLDQDKNRRRSGWTDLCQTWQMIYYLHPASRPKTDSAAECMASQKE